MLERLKYYLLIVRISIAKPSTNYCCFIHVLKNLNYLVNRYTELLLCAGEPKVPHIGGLDLVDAHYLWLTAAKFEE